MGHEVDTPLYTATHHELGKALLFSWQYEDASNHTR